MWPSFSKLGFQNEPKPDRSQTSLENAAYWDYAKQIPWDESLSTYKEWFDYAYR